MTSPLRLACFITPHGFGHAARSSAVLEAWHRLRRQLGETDLRPELFTTVPRWFFEDSLSMPFGYHHEACDVGLVQNDALTEDPAATVERLSELLPVRQERLDRLAHHLHQLECRAVLCDIAPLGLAVARAAGIPSILLENFTWDWIYRAYLDVEPRLAGYADQLQATFAQASLHLQATPYCQLSPDALQVAPISRVPRRSRADVRRQLDVDPKEPLILVTMGGIQWRYRDLEAMRQSSATLVLPGASERREDHPGLRLLPHRSTFFHPDLVSACDAVVGKLGYSTIAEVHRAGLPLGYVPRARFPESPILAQFADEQLCGLEIPQAAFLQGTWSRYLPDLLERSRQNGSTSHATDRDRTPDGALQAATALQNFLDRQDS